MAYSLKDVAIDKLQPGFNVGLGSYINYGLGILVRNQMYANVILNSVLVFLSCIFVKKIALNITQNDMVATTISIIYILTPQALVFVGEYVRYGYNVLVILAGIYTFLHIIDEVKKFNKKNNKYLIYAAVLGVIQSVDIILGGSYILWLVTMLIATSIAMYVDGINIKLGFKQKLGYKLKRLAEKVEKVNISKLLVVSSISLGISVVTTIICSAVGLNTGWQAFSEENALNILMHSRNYYIILIIAALVFEIIAVITKRKIDIKMYIIKIMFIVYSLLMFFMIDNIYGAVAFDVLLILNAIMNICNICYNREERIKLLNDKN